MESLQQRLGKCAADQKVGQQPAQSERGGCQQDADKQRRRRVRGLTPGELAVSPIEFRRSDGTSVFRPRHSAVYSSEAIMAAEARLLDRAEDRTAPGVDVAVMRGVTVRRTEPALTEQQTAALVSIGWVTARV